MIFAIASLVAFAIAGPPADALVAPCPLALAPSATVAWSQDGTIWVLNGGRELAVVNVDEALPKSAGGMHCEGSAITLFRDRGGNSTLAFTRVQIDLTEMLDSLPRSWLDANAIAQVNVTQALTAGDSAAAIAAIAASDDASALPEQLAATHDLALNQARAALRAADWSGVITIASAALALPDAPSALHQLRAEAWLATDQAQAAVDALTRLSPAAAGAWLGEAWWQLGERRRATDAWRTWISATGATPNDDVLDRCKPCRRR